MLMVIIALIKRVLEGVLSIENAMGVKSWRPTNFEAYVVGLMFRIASLLTDGNKIRRFYALGLPLTVVSNGVGATIWKFLCQALLKERCRRQHVLPSCWGYGFAWLSTGATSWFFLQFGTQGEGVSMCCHQLSEEAKEKSL